MCFSEKLHRREDEVSLLLQYIRSIKSAELSSYNGSDVHHIMHILEHVHYPAPDPPGYGSSTNLSTYMQASNSSGAGGSVFVDTYVEHEEQDLLHEVAHGLHFASIALLGFLVIEDAVKIIAMGKLFFKHKIEVGMAT